MKVVETPTFLREAAGALTEAERIELVSFLATNREFPVSVRDWA